MVKVALVGGEKSGKTTLAMKLGKKGTESDIVLYDFVKGDNILSIVDPIGYPKSPKPLVNAVNMADVVVFCIDAAGLDPRAGECIILMDLLKPKHGLVAITKSDTSNPFAIDELKAKVKALSKGTVMEQWDTLVTSTKSFEGIDRLKDILFEYDTRLKEEHKSLLDKPVRVPIDHHFNVTGIGCVILGYVDRGVINAKEKLTIFPNKQEAEIRSIQMHDVDVKQAPAGARVGLALKGIQSKDLDRGYMISASETVADTITLKCTTARFRGEFNAGDKVHLYVGLQSTPAKIEKVVSGGSAVESTKSGAAYEVTIKTDKDVAYSAGDLFLLSRLDDPKQRFLASGTP